MSVSVPPSPPSSLTDGCHTFDYWIPRTVIQQRTSQLAHQLARHYAGKRVRLIAVLRGAKPFHALLVTALHQQTTYRLAIETDSLRAKSYQGTTSGQLRWLRHSTLPPDSGVHAIIVEDIADSGRTIAVIKGCLQNQGYASVASVVLLDRPEARDPAISFTPDFAAFEIANPAVWAVGFGMDVDERYRELPDIYGKRLPGQELPPYALPPLGGQGSQG